MKNLTKLLAILALLYSMLCAGLYFLQEKLIFHPSPLPDDFTYEFQKNFQERSFKVEEDVLLNALHFKADTTRGLIFYLHGNAGTLAHHGQVADLYLQGGYDILMLDYRGFGKSDGEIISEKQLYSDNQMIYNAMLQEYSESDIVVLGYSIGTGMAAKLAVDNQPRDLILLAPYYSMTYMKDMNFSWIPDFVLRYEFPTNALLAEVDAPITIFHGTDDATIPIACSKMLKADYQEKIELVELKGQGHNQMAKNYEYAQGLIEILRPDWYN